MAKRFVYKKTIIYSCENEKVYEKCNFHSLKKNTFYKQKFNQGESISVRRESREIKEGRLHIEEFVHTEDSAVVAHQDLIVGIDPGFTGGFAILGEDETIVGELPIQRYKNKRRIHAKRFAELLRPYASRIKFLAIEDVHSMPNQGVASTFKFGFNAGILHGVAHAMGFKVLPVNPGTWKSQLNLSKKKRESLELASKLYPDQAHHFTKLKDDGKAEALLIAHSAKEVFL